LEKELAGISISSGHLTFLLVLSHSQWLSQDELSFKTGMDKTTTSRVISSLLKLGYITRIRDLEDKRIKRISISEKGRELIPFLDKTVKLWTEALSLGFSEEEKNTANILLLRMAENASKFKAVDFEYPSFLGINY